MLFSCGLRHSSFMSCWDPTCCLSGQDLSWFHLPVSREPALLCMSACRLFGVHVTLDCFPLLLVMLFICVYCYKWWQYILQVDFHKSTGFIALQKKFS